MIRAIVVYRFHEKKIYFFGEINFTKKKTRGNDHTFIVWQECDEKTI